jgi:hypothetical protein
MRLGWSIIAVQERKGSLAFRCAADSPGQAPEIRISFAGVGAGL